MSSTAAQEIELLERVLIRLGNADTDEKLEVTVGKFLTPVLLKITSVHEVVRNKVIEVLTHINKRLKSRSLVQIPVEALLDQYLTSESAFLQNFSIIYITMGFPRLAADKQSDLAAKLMGCLEGKPENHQDKIFMLVFPILGQIKIPDDPVERKHVLGLDERPSTKKQFLAIIQDILLLPYGVTSDSELPPGMSPFAFKRVIANNWRAEELEQLKKGIVRFVCSGVLTDLEAFILLVLASSDTRFSVATPAVAELSKVCTSLDFTDSIVSAPLYVLFSGNSTKVHDRKTTPCSARVRQKLLQYLIKCRGKGINTVKGFQVIFEGLFGENTNQKCKVLSLQFCENLVKDAQPEILSKISKVILSGLSKLIGRESTEAIDVQNAAYSAMAQLARTCPNIVNQDLKMVVSYYNHLAMAPPELHSSIREALISIAPAFAWNHNAMDIEGGSAFTPTAHQNLLLAMLTDNTESKLNIVQNVTSVFLTTCFPEDFAPARFLLVLIAGERTSLREAVTSFLYGVSKKDHINYNMISSIDYPEEVVDDFNKLSAEQRRVVLPNFKKIMNHVWTVAQKRLAHSTQRVVVGRTTLAFNLNVYEEILDYLRLCLWYSAGVKAAPGDEKHTTKLAEYILENYENSEDNEIYKYLKFVQASVEAKRDETNLMCLYDILNAAPEMLTTSQMHLLTPLAISLKDVSETTRIHVAQIYGILLAYGLSDQEFDSEVNEILQSLPQKSLEHRHGLLLVLGHAFNKKVASMGKIMSEKEFGNWNSFVDTLKLLISNLMLEPQYLILGATLKSLSLIGKIAPIIDVEFKIALEDEAIDAKANTKTVLFDVVFNQIKSTSVRAKIREDATNCLGSLAIGNGGYYTMANLKGFISMLKVSKDTTLNIAIAHAIACTLNGYDVNIGPPTSNFVNPHCDDKTFDWFMNKLIKESYEPNPHSRQSCALWLLAAVKNCSTKPNLLAKKQLLQFAFTELLSDNSEFVQDVASRGLGLVFSLSDSNSQKDLADSLLDQLIGGKRKVNQVVADTELFPEGALGKTPTGGNITTYKELCSLASDLNQPEMIYQFMQLANHNATWTSKLGAAFGLKSISKDAKSKMQPYLGKIIPRLYRYKYDPTPKIQNSMISIWDSIVSDSKEVVETYYWDILKEILDNLTFNEWRVRIACCLAARDLLKRPNGLKLRCDERAKKDEGNAMEVDEVPEPELKELWAQLFRVMDDIHEGTRLAAQGTANALSKICVVAASSDHGKSGIAVASSILPLLLENGVTNTVAEIRKISIKTISELIESSGSLITPHLPTLIPCLLRATGELEMTKLSYLSTRLGADTDAQEAVDSLRAEAAKSHHTMETTAKCIRYVDYETLEKMTSAILEMIKTSMNLGTKIACAHFVCLISIRLGQEMTPLVGKYLSACFTGLKDRNAIVRKYYASAIGHLMGIAKEQSIKNLFAKLEEFYMENPANKGVPLTIQAINKRHYELLKDYMENILPLIFFAMHEESTEENKANVELWKELWIEVSPGDAGIRMNLNVIIPKLETTLDDASWSRKTQSANAINTIATRLNTNLDETNRLQLIELMLTAIQGRTFHGKERLLQALASLCKGLDKQHEICARIIDAAMKECRKEEPQYRTHALKSTGDILEELEADRFKEICDMIWYILDKKDFQSIADDDEPSSSTGDVSADERSRRAQIFNKLKETVCETLGKSWPKNCVETQSKYQLMFAERCAQCLRDNTRPVQVSLLVALGKFIDRLKVFDVDGQREKKMKVDASVAVEMEKICAAVLSTVNFASGLPHTGLKKESLNIVLILIKKLSAPENAKYLAMVRKTFEENLQIFQKDSAPEVRCRIKDIDDKLKKL